MALVYVDDLSTGMVLAEDLITPGGRFVLASGAALQRDHLRVLKTWGIYEVDIVEESLSEEYLHQQMLNAGQNEKAEAYLWRRFALNDLDQEPITTIYRYAVRRFSESLQKGWDPISFNVIDLPVVEIKKKSTLTVPQLLKGDVELGSLPTVYEHIVDALNDPEASSQRIAKAISKDANLSLRLLRMVNSPMYGFSGKIDTISRAVSLLGTNDLSSLALGVTVIQQFAKIPVTLLDMDSFWRHSIRCGLFARHLAEMLNLEGSERYFTGGLLHDIGRLVMLDRMPEAYTKAITKARSEQYAMYLAEQDCLQTDHSIVGKLMAMRWRLSPPLMRMIGGHHLPNINHYAIESSLMHVADVLAHAFGHEATLVNEMPPLQEKAWQATGLSADMLPGVILRVDTDFRAVVQVFFGDKAELG